jgi:hypothetical protein
MIFIVGALQAAMNDFATTRSQRVAAHVSLSIVSNTQPELLK